MPRHPIRLFLSAAALLLTLAASAGADVTRFDLSGTVVDGTGGVLPGVTVTLKNVDTGSPLQKSVTAVEQYLTRPPQPRILGGRGVSGAHRGAMTKRADTTTPDLLCRPDVMRSPRARLPAIYAFTAFAEAGGLMAFAADENDEFRRAARFVERILNGAQPAELPVEPPTRFELAINLKTAQSLGLSIQQSLLAQAGEIVE